MLFWILFVIAYLPLLLLFPVKKVGKKNLKQLKGKTYIIASNHMSNNDAPILDIRFAKKHYFLAKKELFKGKVGSAFMKSMGAVKVDRQKVEPSSIKEVFRLINKKKTVCIFPQGTRAKTPVVEEGSAKEGVAMFAIRTNTPVVPMMYNKKLKPFRRVKLYIGEPIYPDPERKGDKTYMAEFADLVVHKMNELLEGDVKKQ